METGIDLLQTWIPLLATIGAFIIAYRAIDVIIDVSHLKKLHDHALEERKSHSDPTPNLGGVGIFVAIFIAFSLSGHAAQTWAPYLAAGMTLLMFSGIKDDILVIDPLKKLIIQIFSILVLMLGGNLVITDLGGVFGFDTIPYAAGFALTFFTMVVVVNSYNLIDGIDGLAGGVGLIASAFFGFWFWDAGMIPHATLSFTLAGSLLAFLWYNFQPASIFMGDTGSQVVGYLLAFMAITFVKSGVTMNGAVLFQDSVPVLVLAVLIVPLYDTLRVFILRVLNGKSPFAADRSHVHHQLIDMGLSHRGACFVLYTYTLGMMGMAKLLTGTVGVNFLLGLILLTTVLLFPTMNLKRNLLQALGIGIPTRHSVKRFEMKNGIYPKQTQPRVPYRSPEKIQQQKEKVRREREHVAV